MTNLDRLIKELCPDGVKIAKLCEVAKICNGKDHKTLLDGNIPVYGSGGIMRYVDCFIYDRESVLIPRKGSISNIFYVDAPFWTVDTIFYTKINTEMIYPKFFYYSLSTQYLEDLNIAGGVPSLTKSVLDRVKLFLPPLPIQREIVRILGNFTELTAELTAELTTELTARKKQYKYYRNALLSFDNDVPMLKLSDVSNISVGGDLPQNFIKGQKKPSKQHPYPIFSNGTEDSALYGFSDSYKIEKEAVTISARGTIGYHAIRAGKFTPIVRLITLIADENVIMTKYLNYALSVAGIEGVKTGIPSLTVPMLEKFRIPLPPLETQACIVAILDKFDALTTDIAAGLPAEIEARTKQYEYYRNKLLTFEEAMA